MTIHGQVRSVSHENGVALVLSGAQAEALGIKTDELYDIAREGSTVVLAVHDEAFDQERFGTIVQETMERYRSAFKRLAE